MLIFDSGVIAQLRRQVLENFPRLDILINNAGIGTFSYGELTTLSEKTWDEVMNVNLRGT